MPEGTLIDTENGLIDIKELHEMKDKPKVLSLSHLSNKLSYNVIKASREIKANEKQQSKQKVGIHLSQLQTTGIMSLDEDTKRQKISNKATISRKTQHV